MARRSPPPRQLTLAFNTTPLADAVVPNEVVQVLAELLLEATGAVQQEDGHEQRDHG